MQRLKLSLLFLFVFISSFATADQGNGCVYIAVNASQRQAFAQFGFATGFQSGCLVVQQDTGIVYEWNGGTYTAIGGGGVGLTTLNAQTGQTQVFANDTNVVITSSSNTHTLGWAGTLSMARGGSGKNITGKSGGIVYGATTTTMDMTAAGTSGQVLMSSGASAPTWGTVDTSVFVLKSGDTMTGALHTIGLYNDGDGVYSNSIYFDTTANYGGIFKDSPCSNDAIKADACETSFYAAGAAGHNILGLKWTTNDAYANSQTTQSMRWQTGNCGAYTNCSTGSLTFHVPDPTGSGTKGIFSIDTQLDLGSHQITNVTDPTLSQSAATKNYVDTNAGTIRSLNSQTGATQIFANDTNVIITSTGNTHTVGWAGTLSLTRGGTGAALTAANGGIVYSTASAQAILPAGTSGQILTSTGAGAPSWQAPTITSWIFEIQGSGSASNVNNTGTGAFTALSWNLRGLNTTDQETGGYVTGNPTLGQWTMNANVRCKIAASYMTGANVGVVRLRLYDSTAAAVVSSINGNPLYGTTTLSTANSTGGGALTMEADLVTSHNYEIDEYSANHSSNNDGGAPLANPGITENFGFVKLECHK